MMEWIVTSSAMILIVIALRGLLKGKISLKLQYGLWALVLIRLLLPFSIVESAISISNVLSAPVIQEADDAVEDYESTYQNVVQQHEASGTEYSDTEIRQQVQQELYDRTYEKIEQEYAQTGAAVPQIQIQTEAQHQVEVISLTAVLTEALPYLWIAGMIVVAVALTGSNLHFWWKLRQSRKAMDIPGVPLKVYLTDYVATPCLFGAVKPDIYLTGEVMSDSQMRRHVIAHEMSHYRQGDHLWSLLRCLCLVLHWYNPLVWAAAILSKQDAELACDEATIKALGEAERVAYGRTLIGMTCVRRDPGSLMLTATTMLGTKKTLKERIALIAKKPKTALYTLIACILVVSLAVGCTFTGAPTEPTEEKDRIWQQVVEAVEQRNSSQSQHMTLFVRAEDIHEIDFETTPKNSEYWTYGGTCYTELNTLDGMVPHILQHNGKIYNHEDQNRWTSFGDSTDSLLTYLDLPRDENLVTGWTELDGQLEVVLKNGTEDWTARLDAEGNLLWLVTENIGLTWVYYYHDTPEQEIRQKVESVVSNMEIIERDDVLTAQEMLLLDRCGEAVEYIQNLEHFEITEHYEIIEESDFVLGPNSVEVRYVYSGDDWYHNRVTPDWTWQFLEKDGEQFRKDITNAVPEEDIPAIEWIRADLSENYYAQHAWIMDIYWRNKTIGYLTYTGNGNGYEGGSMTPISVTYDAEGSSEWISVEFEPGGEQVYDSEAGEGIRWILTFRFDRETGIVTEVTREIGMEDREIHVAGINGGTEHVDFHSTSTLIITPGTEEEMSAIIDDIYNDEILTAVSGQESPTAPIGPNTTNIDLDLTGMVVDADGNIKNHLQENVNVTIQGTRTDKAEGYDELELDIAFSDNYRYVIGHLPTVSYSSDSDYILLDYDVCMGYGYDGVAATSRAVRFAMSTDREYLILEWEGVDGEYLVASADPDTTPAEIMEYFREYLEVFSFSTSPTTEPTEPPTEPVLDWDIPDYPQLAYDEYFSETRYYYYEAQGENSKQLYSWGGWDNGKDKCEVWMEDGMILAGSSLSGKYVQVGTETYKNTKITCCDEFWIYAIKDRTELFRIDYNGENRQTLYVDETQKIAPFDITYTHVRDNSVLFFVAAAGSDYGIYRLYLPDMTLDLLYTTEAKPFLYGPYSNFEITWSSDVKEVVNNVSEIDYYYNCLTGELLERPVYGDRSWGSTTWAWWEEMSEPTEPPTEPTEPNPEIAKFQELLTYENGYWYWRAMGCVFENPDELSLEYLFYNGLKYEERQDSSTYTDNEVAFLKQFATDTWGSDALWRSAHKLPRESIIDVLASYFSMNLEDVSIPENWAYFEETDSYYCIRMDGYGIDYQEIESVQFGDNGNVQVYWTTTDWIMDTRSDPAAWIIPQEKAVMVMTLQQQDDGTYVVLSNLPAE